MADPTTPPNLASLLDTFRPCFTKKGHTNFAILVVGWIVCQGRHWITRVIQAGGSVAFARHHSSFYRFLSQGRWAGDSIGHVLFQLVLSKLSATITILVDDTLNSRTGPHIFGAGMHYDAARSTYGRGTAAGRKHFFTFGNNWTFLAVWVPLPWNRRRGIALPILFRLYQSKKRCRGTYRKRTELALDMIRVLVEWIPQTRKVHLLGDNEYACRTVVRNLPENWSFTGPVTMNAALFAPPDEKHRGRGRPSKKGKRLASPRELVCSSSGWRKRTVMIYNRQVEILLKSQMCFWYTVGATRLMRVVVTRDPRGRIDDRAYFTTDTMLEAEEALLAYARRWEIEVTFRNLKQAMGIEDPQNGWWRRRHGSREPKKRPGPNPRARRGQEAITHTVALALASYALVVIWYLEHGAPKKDVRWAQAEAPWYTHKSSVSFNDMLAAIRREIWTARISKNPLLKGMVEKIRGLLPHSLLAA